MDKRSKWPPVYVIGLLVVAAAFAFTGTDDAPRAFSRAAPAASDSIPDLVGTWTGMWHDTVYPPAAGALSWEITQDASSFSATGSIDLSWFGMGTVPGSAAGTLARDVLDFSFEAPGAGDGSGTLTDGVISGTGTMIAPAFGDFTFEGTISDETIDAAFDFTDPGGGAGTMVLTKDTPVEPASWGQVKARFRDTGE